MKMLPIFAFSATALMTAACTASSTPPQSAGPAPDAFICKADGLSVFVGQLASSDLGAQILAASGAKSLRWAPPRSAMTMDYRPDRLTVSYGDDMLVTRAACG
ncbi:MAG: I78 family peptidase inhibitor [Sphingobium sp.]